MKAPVILVMMLLLQAATRNALADSTVPIPLSPTELIACQPAAPGDWKVTASTASDTFSGSRMSTHAQRELKQDPPPPPPGQPPSPPAEPALMTIHLTDTGVKGEFKTTVLAPQSGVPANTTYLKLKDFPARLIKTDEKTLILNLLIQDRFLVEIRTTNVAWEDLKKIAGNLVFSKLEAMPSAAMGHLSDPAILSRVDELHPQKSRSYPVYWQPAPSL